MESGETATRNKPVIGVMPLWDEDKVSLWMLPAYLDGIIQAGGIPVIFPFTEETDDVKILVDTVDGVIMTGGQDVNPDRYGQELLGEMVVPCEKRDGLEFKVMQEILKSRKPILGICRGLQVINVALGGSLYQDLPTQHPSDINHRQPAPYDIPSHEVEVLPDTPLRHCLGDERINVNSCHHQAIKELAEPLEAMAISTDGLVEGVYRPDYPFLWAVQWHPEFMQKKDENSQRIFKSFIQATMWK